MLKIKFSILGIITLLVFSLGFVSCEFFTTTSASSRTYHQSVQKVVFTDNTATVTFHNLSANSIYLVKVNTSENVAQAANTGRALNVSLDLIKNEAAPSRSLLPEPERALPKMGHPQARRFSADPPVILRSVHRSVELPVINPAILGDQKSFWVEEVFDTDRWTQKMSTLMATGKHGNIWVVNSNNRQITVAQARAIAERFDVIYPSTTNIFGYEFGGGPGGHGGVDGDPKVQILVYDINDAQGNPGVAGFFWGKDLLTQSQLNSIGMSARTNMAEIFYIDANILINAPEFIYSTLVHELQHMIHFNVKTVEHGIASETWYNEMLSMVAEDLVAPLIGISATNRSHPVQYRIPSFLEAYNQIGAAEWLGGSNIEETSNQYGVTYAFGAYILRNFGGPSLIRRISLNDTSGISSVSSALQEVADVTFEQALSRFGEAMIFSGESIPAGALTFDRTVSGSVSGTQYTATGFDIWSMRQARSSRMGPAVFSLTQMEMRPHSILVQSSNAWQNLSGSYSITLEKPSNANIELYLMVH